MTTEGFQKGSGEELREPSASTGEIIETESGRFKRFLHRWAVGPFTVLALGALIPSDDTVRTPVIERSPVRGPSGPSEKPATAPVESIPIRPPTVEDFLDAISHSQQIPLPAELRRELKLKLDRLVEEFGNVIFANLANAHNSSLAFNAERPTLRFSGFETFGITNEEFAAVCDPRFYPGGWITNALRSVEAAQVETLPANTVTPERLRAQTHAWNDTMTFFGTPRGAAEDRESMRRKFMETYARELERNPPYIKNEPNIFKGAVTAALLHTFDHEIGHANAPDGSNILTFEERLEWLCKVADAFAAGERRDSPMSRYAAQVRIPDDQKLEHFVKMNEWFAELNAAYFSFSVELRAQSPVEYAFIDSYIKYFDAGFDSVRAAEAQIRKLHELFPLVVQPR